jgi:hypothetical protein
MAGRHALHEDEVERRERTRDQEAADEADDYGEPDEHRVQQRVAAQTWAVCVRRHSFAAWISVSPSAQG